MRRSAGFQRARPVRAVAVRAGEEPAVEVLGDGVEVRLLAGERVALRERHEVQVAVGLPQVLDVADHIRVAVVEQLAERERRLDPGLRVAVPARRLPEVDVAQREHVDPAVRDALGGVNIGFGVDLRIGLDPGIRQGSQIGRGHVALARDARALGARLDRAHRAIGHLRRRHAAQPIEAPLPLLQARRRLRCQISRFRSVHRAVSWLRRPAR